MVVANYIVMCHHNLNTHNHDNLKSYLTQRNLKDAFFWYVSLSPHCGSHVSDRTDTETVVPCRIPILNALLKFGSVDMILSIWDKQTVQFPYKVAV